MGSKLLRPLNDIVFKALFGREENQSKILLIDFLNAVLKLKNENRIKEVIYLNPFNLQEFDGDKGSILDLKVKTEKGERINIEIQLNKVDDFRKRSLYYWSKMYAETIEEGESYTKLRKSIVINLIDFNLIDESERYHTVYKIMETEENFALVDDLEIHYVELKKFERLVDFSEEEELEGIEIWLAFIKKAGKDGTERLLENLVERSDKIKMAKEMLERISGDELLRQKYYAREKARLDEVSRIKYAEMKGMEKGMEKGLQKGLEDGMKAKALEIAKTALKEGTNIELIAKITGLSVEELKNLR